MRYLKTIILLIALQLVSSIAVSQNTSKDSICFSQYQGKKILKDLNKLSYFDSITQNQELQIINFKNVLKVDKEIITSHISRINELHKDLARANIRLKISRKLTFLGVPIAIGGGFLLCSILK